MPSFYDSFRLLDSFRNFLSGLGLQGRDKGVTAVPSLKLLSPIELHNLYRGDWLSRKIIDIPAFDACRAWRSWQADDNQIEALEEAERSFGLQRKMQDALTKARLYGGSAMIMGIKNSGDWNTELDIEKVGKDDLAFIHVVERWMIAPGPRVLDITSQWYGEPTYYMKSVTPVPPPMGGVTPPPPPEVNEGNKTGTPSALYIHPSRVVRFIGLDYPDIEQAPDAWGDSVLQPVYDAIRDASTVGQSIANLTSRASVSVIKVPGLTEGMQTSDGTTRITNRFANINAAQSVVNAILLDSSEEWNQLNVQFSGLHDIQQMYLLVACGAADIPSTRLLGREPAGMSATGDSDTRNYYDRLSSEQQVKYTPALTRLDEVLIRHTFGKRDPNIYYLWNPLWQMPTETKAAVDLSKAKTFQIDVTSGIWDPAVLKVARENQVIEDGTYPGVEAALEENAQINAEADETSEEDEDETDIADRMTDQSVLSFRVSGGTRRRRRKPYSATLHMPVAQAAE